MWPFTRKSRDTPEKRMVNRIVEYTKCLLSTHGDQVNASEDRRIAFIVFLFGGLTALAVREGMTAAQAHAVAITLFHKCFEMSPEESVGMAQFCIEASGKDFPWSRAFHEGGDEFLAWEANPDSFAPSRLGTVLDEAPRKDA